MSSTSRTLKTAGVCWLLAIACSATRIHDVGDMDSENQAGETNEAIAGNPSDPGGPDAGGTALVAPAAPP